jgi:ABC-type uncharacterized transport system fused permease/ATPase subunit
MVGLGLLLAVIALDLGKVYISVRINAWNNAFYNAVQAFNSGELFRQLGTFCILVGFAIAMSVYTLGDLRTGGDPSRQVGNSTHTCLYGLDSISLRRCRYLAHGQNRSAVGAVEC